MTQQHHDSSTAAPADDMLERQIKIAARPETVFAFFIDPAMMMRWMGQHVTLDPRPGGMFRNDIDGQHIARGEYIEVVPHSRVVFTWGWEGEGNATPPGASTVEVLLVADGDGTLLRLRHLGLSAAERASHGQGWDLFIPRLVDAAEGRDPASAQTM
jgi:uncharacterized protein YndB with AHSA1/START domain